MVYTQSLSDSNKNRVTGILEALHKCLASMSGYLMATNTAILNCNITRAEKMIIHRYNAFFQRR